MLDKPRISVSDNPTAANSDSVPQCEPAAAQFAALPEGVKKHNAIRRCKAFIRLRGEGGQKTDTDILVFEAVAEMTEYDSWTSTAREPFNWRKLRDIAKALDKNPRTVNRSLKRLEDMGLIESKVGTRGYRGPRRGRTDGLRKVDGTSLQPVIKNYANMKTALDAGKEAETKRRKVYWNINDLKPKIREEQATIEDCELREELQRDYKALEALQPNESLRYLEIEELQQILSRLEQHKNRILYATMGLDWPQVEITQKQEVMARASDTGVTRQYTIEQHMNLCNDLRKGEDENSEDIAKEPTPARGTTGTDRTALTTAAEPTPGKAESTSNETTTAPPPKPKTTLDPGLMRGLFRNPDSLNNVLSDDAALIWAATGWTDLQSAARLLCDHLKVDAGAWYNAVKVMSEPIALLALFALDRNRFHPTRPVKNPGGALRAVTREAQAGMFDLTRSIQAILNRDKRGIQPKATA